MPFKIIRQDITKIRCDAIVNPTNMDLYAGGGLDFKIREAAGKGLYDFCRNHKINNIGDAIISPSFNLPCKYVIHVAGPIYDGSDSCEALLRKSYRSCLELAEENNCTDVAFPLISSGTNGFPKDKVLKIATEAIVDYLTHSDMWIYIAVFDKNSYEVSSKLFSDVVSYIDENYVNESEKCFRSTRRRIQAPISSCEIKSREASFEYSLESMLKNMDKSFSETLFEYIDKKGISDVECYKRSNVDKKVFSKIKCNRQYRPSKITAVSFAIGLKLSIAEAENLLKTAGIALSASNEFDIIIRYFLETGNYDTIFDVNEILYKLDQCLLGV